VLLRSATSRSFPPLRFPSPSLAQRENRENEEKRRRKAREKKEKTKTSWRKEYGGNSLSSRQLEPPSGSIVDCLLMAVLHPIRINYRYSFRILHTPARLEWPRGETRFMETISRRTRPIRSPSLFFFPSLIALVNVNQAR